MKKVRLVVREKIIGVHDDLSLRALNGYYESPFEEFEDNLTNEESFDKLEMLYKAEYENMLVDSIELVFKK